MISPQSNNVCAEFRLFFVVDDSRIKKNVLFLKGVVYFDIDGLDVKPHDLLTTPLNVCQ